MSVNSSSRRFLRFASPPPVVELLQYPHLPLKVSSLAMLAALAVLSALSTSARAQSTGAIVGQDGAPTLGIVVVTSRNHEEVAQDVPIPMSVISGNSLEREGVVTLEDLVKKAPGLEATTPNSRRTGISIRGIGKSAGNDALEASMGVVVDGIFLTHPGMSYQDYTDLDRVEVLRGPQGTLLGKNTTIGAINYVSKAPSFTPQASVSTSIGNYNSRTFNGSISNALIDDVLAFRASVFSDKQDGYLENVNPTGGSTHEKNRSGGRLQFLLTPTTAFSAKLNLDYSQSDERSNTKPTMALYSNYDNATNSLRATSTKPTFLTRFLRPSFADYTPIVGSWTQEDINVNIPLKTENTGATAELNWDLGNNLNLTSITGARRLAFDAKNDSDGTKFDVGQSGTKLDAGQFSQEFRLAQVLNKQFDYQTGLYYGHSWNTTISRSLYATDAGAWYATTPDYNTLYKTAAGRQLLQASLNNAFVTNTETPDTESLAAFGQVNWHINDKTTLTAGLRDTSERKTNTSTKQALDYSGSALANLDTLGAALNASAAEIAAAKNTRNSTVGTTYATKPGQDVTGNAVGWLLSPSYNINSNTLLYASASAGQKSGAVQFTSSGDPLNVNPEKVFDLEVGFKTVLNGNLMLNVNAYQTRVKDYQQTTSIYDDATTKTKNDGTLYYQSVLGNIPGIVAKGVEVDGAWSPANNLTFSFGAALNNAKYSDWTSATCPTELNAAKNVVCDNTGKQVVAAPKVIVTLGADYRHSLPLGYTGHAWFNDVYRSRQNFDNTLSNYGWQEAYSVTDVGIGLTFGQRDKFELDLVAKNLFNTQYTTSINGAGTDRVTYDGMGAPRSVGLVFHAKL